MLISPLPQHSTSCSMGTPLRASRQERNVCHWHLQRGHVCVRTRHWCTIHCRLLLSSTIAGGQPWSWYDTISAWNQLQHAVGVQVWRREFAAAATAAPYNNISHVFKNCCLSLTPFDFSRRHLVSVLVDQDQYAQHRVIADFRCNASVCMELQKKYHLLYASHSFHNRHATIFANRVN